MTNLTDAALDSWIAWIDDLPMPPEFQDGLEGLQDAITAMRAENATLRAQVAEARAKVALLDDAISYTSEQALASEIPVGYGPEDRGAWTQGYDAAIRHARRARTRALIAQAEGETK